MTQLESISQLSKRSGKRARTLQRICVRLGIPKIGSFFALTPEQSEMVLSAAREKAGCPLFVEKNNYASAERKRTSGKTSK